MANELLPRYDVELSTLLAHGESLVGSGPDWLRALRQKGIDTHREFGVPTPKNEEWKYTPLRPLTTLDLKSSEPGPAVFGIDLQWNEGADKVLVVNGRLDRNQLEVTKSDGLTIKSLRDAINENGDLVKKHLGLIAKQESHTFAALNTAIFEDGVFLHLAKGATIERPIEIVHVTNGDGQCVAPRVLIVAEEGAIAKIVETYLTDGEGTNLVLPVTEVYAATGTNVEHVRVQDESESTYSAALWAIKQEGGSEYRSYNVAFGGAIARTDQEFWLGGEHIVTRLDGVVVASGKQHIDNHTRLDHAKPNCNSFEVYKQIVDDEGTVVFNGKIFVYKDAQKTDAVQNNAALLLSPKATIDSKPQLEIFADDVKCTHGATVGRLEDTPLFYLRSRGISKEQAEGILVYAFAAEVLELITMDSVRDRLEARLFEKLSV
ncbi:MAG TPA: Fe-S cluster assembly protein SufD [Fimbriimonadaceae bacterium]|nr:Fe-S cluster assembly protein SufD [Fimbriimonadaceae bacterium]